MQESSEDEEQVNAAECLSASADGCQKGFELDENIIEEEIVKSNGRNKIIRTPENVSQVKRKIIITKKALAQDEPTGSLRAKRLEESPPLSFVNSLYSLETMPESSEEEEQVTVVPRLSSTTNGCQRGVELEENTIKQEIGKSSGTIPAICSSETVSPVERIRSMSEKRLAQDKPSCSSRAERVEEPAHTSFRSQLPAEFNDFQNVPAEKPLDLSKKSSSWKKQNTFCSEKQEENTQVPETIDLTHLEELPSLQKYNGSTSEQEKKIYFHSKEMKKCETTECSDTLKRETTKCSDTLKSETTECSDTLKSETTECSDTLKSETTECSDTLKSETTECSDTLKSETTECSDKLKSERQHIHFRKKWIKRINKSESNVDLLAGCSTNTGESCSYDSRRTSGIDTRLPDSRSTDISVRDLLPPRYLENTGEGHSYDSSTMLGENSRVCDSRSTSKNLPVTDFYTFRPSANTGESCTYDSSRTPRIDSRLSHSGSTDTSVRDILFRPSIITRRNRSYNSTNQFPFVCENNVMAFPKKHWLTRHNQNDVCKKEFICEICNKSLSSKALLKKHKKAKKH